MTVMRAPDWYKCRISKQDWKRVTRRQDGPALIWLAGYIAAAVVTGYLAVESIGTWFLVPAFLIYGNVYCMSDSLLHETHHGTPFRTRWLNELVHFFAGVVGFKEATYDRWKHTNHHSFTVHPGIDLEIQAPRPPSLTKMLSDLIVGFMFVIKNATLPVLHSFGIISATTRSFVPESEIGKMIWSARAWVFVQLCIIALAVAIHSWLPIILTFGARLYGPFLVNFLAYTQHAGLAENALDHRLNTRTICMNPVIRFLYWNMNYHIEHHMFPMVPFYNLPALHEVIKDQLPRTYTSIWDAYREIVPTLLHQRRDPTYFVQPALPDAAMPVAGSPHAA